MGEVGRSKSDRHLGGGRLLGGSRAEFVHVDELEALEFLLVTILGVDRTRCRGVPPARDEKLAFNTTTL